MPVFKRPTVFPGIRIFGDGFTPVVDRINAAPIIILDEFDNSILEDANQMITG
jgi:hypothetical protein